MDLQELLTREGDQIIAEASEALTRSQLAHYAEAGHAVGQERLARLFQLTAQGIADRNLVPVMEYMAEVADDRFHAGYAIREVQIAINVLEEAIWNHIVANVPPNELARALGLVKMCIRDSSSTRASRSVAATTSAPCSWALAAKSR